MSLAKGPAAPSRAVRGGPCGRALNIELTIRAVFGAIVTLLSGCSLITDADREQCSDVSDCVKQLGDANSYTCEQNLCRMKLECERNEECLSPGKSFCVANACVECAVKTDCASSTASCVANVCEDPLWGCLKDPDNRPVPTSSTATLTVKAPNAITMAPLPGLSVRVCLESLIDPSCATPFPGATGSYDPATGLATVVGIPNGRLYRFQLDPLAGSGLTPRDFYTNRPARGTERIPDDLGIVPITVLTGLQTPFPIDIKRPFVAVRIYDCLGNPAEGVTVSLADQPADLVTGYLTEAQALRYDLTATSKLGYMGFLNVKPGVSTLLSAKVGTKEVITYQFIPLAERTQTVDVYPRAYSSRPL